MQKNKDFYTVRGYQILNSENKLLTSSMEDYLEMIYRICLKEGYVRINQLAIKLNVRPSSTTKIVQRLSELSLVDYKRYGIIKLTDAGKELGEYLLKRHEIIQEFLKNIGIEETLLRDTELIEHDVSTNALGNMYIFNIFFSENPEIKKRYDKFRKNNFFL